MKIACYRDLCKYTLMKRENLHEGGGNGGDNG
jgi:hypothetical protein